MSTLQGHDSGSLVAFEDSAQHSVTGIRLTASEREFVGEVDGGAVAEVVVGVGAHHGIGVAGINGERSETRNRAVERIVGVVDGVSVGVGNCKLQALRGCLL